MKSGERARKGEDPGDRRLQCAKRGAGGKEKCVAWGVSINNERNGKRPTANNEAAVQAVFDEKGEGLACRT